MNGKPSKHFIGHRFVSFTNFTIVRQILKLKGSRKTLTLAQAENIQHIFKITHLIGIICIKIKLFSRR